MKYPLYQDNLCPKLWKEKKLDPEVQKGLLDIAVDFVNELRDNHNLHIEILDVVIIGSVANYNWTPYSDIDLHVITDYSKLGIPAEEAQIMFDALKTTWNSKHDITVKGHDVEMYIQDKDYKPSSAAEYSILKDKWIKEPKRETPSFDKELIKKKYKEYKKKIDSFVKEGNEKALRSLLDKLYKYRQAGLDKGGELSEENIIFKILRAKGHLDRIKDTVTSLYDKKMSIREVKVSPESPAGQFLKQFHAPEHVQIDLMAYGPETVSIESLFIDPDRRGFGRGTQTLNTLTQLADKLGVALELEIGHDEGEIDLVRWYQKAGFKNMRGYWRREPRTDEQEGLVRDGIWPELDPETDLPNEKKPKIRIDPDGDSPYDELVPTDNMNKPKIRKVFGINVYPAYQVSTGTETLPDSLEMLKAIRHAIKHPVDGGQEKLVSKLVINSVNDLASKVDLSSFDVIIPLGSKSTLNMFIAEQIVERAKKDIPILSGFIVKDVWKNVQVRPNMPKSLGPNPSKKQIDAYRQLALKRDKGFLAASAHLEKMKKEHPDDPFEIKNTGGVGRSLRQYYTLFYKTADGYSVDLTKKITGGKVLIIDDTLEGGTTLIEALRVIKNFQPKDTLAYIFLFGRYGGAKSNFATHADRTRQAKITKGA